MAFNNYQNQNIRQIPPSCPPKFTPQYCSCMKGTGPKLIKQYLKLYIFVWTIQKCSFWMYPISLNGNIISGYVWDHSYWKFVHFNINKIDCIY